MCCPEELDTKDAAPVTEDSSAMSKRPGFSGESTVQFQCSVTHAHSHQGVADSSWSVLLRPQSAWSPSCRASTWPTRCASRSRTCSTGSTGRPWASSTPSKCLTRGSRTTRTRSSSRASRPASPSGSPAPSARRTWRGSWRWPTRSASPSPGHVTPSLL